MAVIIVEIYGAIFLISLLGSFLLRKRFGMEAGSLLTTLLIAFVMAAAFTARDFAIDNGYISRSMTWPVVLIVLCVIGGSGLGYYLNDQRRRLVGAD